ncbi:MAG TPA: GNAT family N-acetyltransferase [Halomonas sp.]|nr:GNAT family N-acetyltransferase [Halomonas sp.]
MTRIRAFRTTDWPALWALIEPVFLAGDTYAVPRDITQASARRLWVETPNAVQVAEDEAGRLLGSYYLKANQPGPGAHVANCGYVVAKAARGQGIAASLCEHSLALAREQGFTAMQYNLVVSTNQTAVRLWQRHGFEIVGVLPDAFRHPTAGLVDAFVMYRQL